MFWTPNKWFDILHITYNDFYRFCVFGGWQTSPDALNKWISGDPPGPRALAVNTLRSPLGPPRGTGYTLGIPGGPRGSPVHPQIPPWPLNHGVRNMLIMSEAPPWRSQWFPLWGPPRFPLWRPWMPACLHGRVRCKFKPSPRAMPQGI